ncbi:MAG: hypothetical protein ABIH89_03580 [Elusimicrobiota bacterium]
MKKLIVFCGIMVFMLPVVGMTAGMEHAVDTSGADVLITRTYANNGLLIETHNMQDDTYTTYENGKALQTTLEGDVIASYHYENGVLKTVTDQYQNTTFYENGMKTSKENHNNETVAVYTYDAAGRLTTVTDPRITDGTGVTKYNYDGKILLSMEGFDQNGLATITHFESGRQTYTQTQLEGGDWVTTAVYEYDGVKLSKVYTFAATEGGYTGTSADTSSASYTGYTTYDSHGRPDRSYDMEGNLASVTIYEGAFIKQQVSFPGGAEGAYINVTDYNEFGEAGTTYQVSNPGGW